HVILLTPHARSHAADAEAAHLGLAEEEAVGQPDILAQALDIAALDPGREDEAAAKAPIFGRLGNGLDIAHLAAETGEILAQQHALAAGRPDAVVEIVEHQRIADRRGQSLADRVAEITAGEDRVALAVGVEGELVERDIVIAQPVTRRERDEL